MGAAKASVELRFPPSPGHVRTARLVAAAVARRAHLDEVRLDELRLAVGEACARAVRRCLLSECGSPVVLTVDDTGPGLVIDVADAASVPQRDEHDDPVVLSLLRGLADELHVLDGTGGSGGRVRMAWWFPTRPGSDPGPSSGPSAPIR
jgi:anti-sigma regulatory factor (Ser/Thr protein kinase)